MRVIFFFLAAIALGGCATKQYFHTSLTDPAEIERRKVVDDAHCTRVALGSVDVPEVDYQPSPSYRSSGTISGYNSDGSYSSYTYSGTTRQSAANSFSQGFANGMNIGAAIAARNAQEKIYHGCMVSKGWSDEPAMAGTRVVKRSEKDIAEAEWRTTIDQFLKMEAARPDGIDYARDELKMLQLDITVKQLANDPRNESKSMQWFLIEADRIVKEHYSPERMFFPKKN